MSESFAKLAKNEILGCALHSRGEEIAFLSGFVHTAGSIMISRGGMELVLTNENPLACERVFGLLSKSYGDSCGTEFDGKRISVAGDRAARVLEDCKILVTDGGGEKRINYGIDPSLTEKEKCAAAYLKGAFAGCGSVSVSKGYHLEFALSNASLAGGLAEVMRSYGINANITERKEKFVSYVKGADGVSDALALLGAPRAVLELNSRFADREVLAHANRVKNCDLANIDKAVSAAANQILAIKALKETGKFDLLDGKLKETAVLREENPDMTLSELAAFAGITKSGMKHRLEKLVELGEREKKTDGRQTK